MVARGEIWWHDDPEQGRRPYLILTRNEAIPVLNQLVGVPATRTIRAIPTEVAVDEGDGMPEACALSFDNITAIRRSYCTERITTLGPARMAEACEALAAATAC